MSREVPRFANVDVNKVDIFLRNRINSTCLKRLADKHSNKLGNKHFTSRQKQSRDLLTFIHRYVNLHNLFIVFLCTDVY